MVTVFHSQNADTGGMWQWGLDKNVMPPAVQLELMRNYGKSEN